MTHSAQVLQQIRDLLQLSGVSSEEVIEELVDHYLSQIEDQVGQGINEQEAIRKAYQQIANTDLSPSANQKQRRIHPILFGISIVLMIGIAYHWPCGSKAYTSPPPAIQSHTDEAPTGWPIADIATEISSEFGMRYHPIIQAKRFHKGIDLIADMGTEVLSTGAGMVVTADYDHKLGHHVIIKHSEVYSTKYAHLRDMLVQAGDIVQHGDIIGTVGTSGVSTAPHLHYEVIKDKQAIDPRSVARP